MHSRHRSHSATNEPNSIWPIFAVMVPGAFLGAVILIYSIDWLSSHHW